VSAWDELDLRVIDTAVRLELVFTVASRQKAAVLNTTCLNEL